MVLCLPHQQKHLAIEPGDTVEMTDVLFTGQGFGPVLVIALWNRRYDGPLYLVSNLDLLEEVCLFYRRRFSIETFAEVTPGVTDFSDQKSRGFYVGHSHLSEPMCLQRLLATCAGYVSCVSADGMPGSARCARRLACLSASRASLRSEPVQIGLLWMDQCLNQGWPVPVMLRVPTET